MKKTNHKKIYSKLKSLKDFYKKKTPRNETGFELIFGQRGTGKTTVLAKQYLQWLNKKVNKKHCHKYFYSNVQYKLITQDYYVLDLNNYRITDYIERTPKAIKWKCCTTPKNREDTPFKIKENSIIQIDEIGILYHARSFKEMPQEFINLTKVCRHLQLKLICCSQQYDIDKALRQTANNLYLMNKIGNLNYKRKIIKEIIIRDDKTEEGKAESQICDNVKFAPILQKGSIEFTFIPFYTNLFNSFD